MKISAESQIYSMSAENRPVATVRNGSEVIFETRDCFGEQITSPDTLIENINWSRINPATGPVWVEEAMPGDILRVHIRRINFTRQYAVMVTVPGAGVLADELTRPAVIMVPVSHGSATLPGDVRIPLNPMIGVIGVAPAEGASVSCGTPGMHGGNMDCRLITEGTTLYLPVNVPGALFALGDLHAAMGDGEVSVCGLEISGEVTVELTAIKNSRLPVPALETREALCTLASALTLDEAADIAARNMAHFITDNTSLTLSEAVSLMSVSGNLEICQVVDPLKTCRYVLPKSVAAQLSLYFQE